MKKLPKNLSEVQKKSQTLTDDLISHSTVDDTNSKMKMEYYDLLAAIVEYSEDSIISKSLDGTIKSWNKGSEKMFGYTSRETIGKNISLIIPPAFMDIDKNIMERVSNNESIVPYETIRIKKNGNQLHVSITSSPIKDNKGNIIGASIIGRDVTFRKKFEEDLVAANKELAFQIEEKEKRAAELIISNDELVVAENRLKEVNIELEAFTYSVSHDLRAPLRAVNSYAQILTEDYGQALDADGKVILDNIRYNTKKMGALIDELLSFSRLGRKEIDRTLIDMNDLMQSVLANIKRTIENKATIRLSHMPAVKADHILLQQVLFNLLSNAIKYSSKKEYPLIEIFTELQNNKTVFAIKDNGAGFDMRFADKLFGVFQRLHSEKEFEGNGVGLAIVQRIISKHGGRVWGEGIVNEGAIFYFTLN
ncbi:MAG: PAS domain S-box protein [Sediminibacterium sp.]